MLVEHGSIDTDTFLEFIPTISDHFGQAVSRPQFSRSCFTRQVIAGPTRTFCDASGRRSVFWNHVVGEQGARRAVNRGRGLFQVSKGQSDAYASPCLSLASGVHRNKRCQTNAGTVARIKGQGSERRGFGCGIRVKTWRVQSNDWSLVKCVNVDGCWEITVMLASAGIFPFDRQQFNGTL